ncbi:NYN domain-containing protein [Methylophilus sp. DW102]|uniref:NYN domain-containing protein n=1 Tax=Methylophilus sp. DW102 TaxID=3095607 RepID=UPI00309397BD|nr:NYN domain-containing protein [Methylophilus sp. DW102]
MNLDAQNPRLAVLIDADNAQAAIIEGLLSEVAKFGIASVKRIYGDWTTPNLGQWKTTLLNHSIQPIQQFRYTTGKNATDSAMIIDAMDLLYSGALDGFCIVSSDSDFTRLASRIRESGKRVYGFGEKKTPSAFVAACDRFIYTELFLEQPQDKETTKIPGNKLRQDTKLVNLIRTAIDTASNEDGWAHLGPVGSNIVKNAPEFDPRNYGYGKLSDLIKAIELFEIEKQQTHLILRNKTKK